MMMTDRLSKILILWIRLYRQTKAEQSMSSAIGQCVIVYTHQRNGGKNHVPVSQHNQKANPQW